MNKVIPTEPNIIVTNSQLIKAGGIKSFPKVAEVAFPATIAPKKTIIPKSPGIIDFRITFDPYAAEKEGDILVPPILMARKTAAKSGISM
jgi:hypothetical protein